MTRAEAYEQGYDGPDSPETFEIVDEVPRLAGLTCGIWWDPWGEDGPTAFVWDGRAEDVAISFEEEQALIVSREHRTPRAPTHVRSLEEMLAAIDEEAARIRRKRR